MKLHLICLFTIIGYLLLEYLIDSDDERRHACSKTRPKTNKPASIIYVLVRGKITSVSFQQITSMHHWLACMGQLKISFSDVP